MRVVERNESKPGPPVRQRAGGLVVCVSRPRLQRSLGAWRAKSFGGYLVDPASGHMLVSKTKPCKSKYKVILY